MVESLRNKGQFVHTFTELSAVYAPPEDPLVVAAAEQVLLAAASPFHFSPSDLYADQVVTLRERLGMPSARDERTTWTIHTHIPAEERWKALPQPVCELGPED